MGSQDAPIKIDYKAAIVRKRTTSSRLARTRRRCGKGETRMVRVHGGVVGAARQFTLFRHQELAAPRDYIE